MQPGDSHAWTLFLLLDSQIIAVARRALHDVGEITSVRQGFVLGQVFDRRFIRRMFGMF